MNSKKLCITLINIRPNWILVFCKLEVMVVQRFYYITTRVRVTMQFQDVMTACLFVKLINVLYDDNHTLILALVV